MAVNAPKNVLKNPAVCASAFGRIFYAEGSNVFFSQVLITAKDAGRCYQNNDPTSEDIPDLLDTDGGVITLEESVSIRGVKPFKSGVLIFATNGVWYIYNPDGGFKATAFNVAKISEKGCQRPKSIVEAEGAVYYVSNDAIMRISASEFDVLSSEDISSPLIRTYFLDVIAGRKTHGIYDPAEKQIIWWNEDLTSSGLIFDTEIGAFYPQRQPTNKHIIVKPIKINNAILYPHWFSDATNNRIEYNLAQPTSLTFKDFGETDINAFLVTGYESLGKFANQKSITQAKVFFEKTETEITGYEDGAYTFDRPSGCLFQARWDYDNSNAYNKWTGVVGSEGTGSEIQLYKPMKRGFLPTEFPTDFDTGEQVIRNKMNIRGSGDAVQFVFQTEPEKDMKLLGYSVTYKMKGRM